MIGPSGEDPYIEKVETTKSIDLYEKMNCGDADLAKVLYLMTKDKYVCASIKGDKWFRFVNHRWLEDDSGTSLRRGHAPRDTFHAPSTFQCFR